MNERPADATRDDRSLLVWPLVCDTLSMKDAGLAVKGCDDRAYVRARNAAASGENTRERFASECCDRALHYLRIYLSADRYTSPNIHIADAAPHDCTGYLTGALIYGAIDYLNRNPP